MVKLFILGLDCATPQLIFDKYLNEMPTITSLIKNANFGKLESTVPPITVPAWMSMVTGKDPGQLGFYGFTDRKDYSYDNNYIVTYNSVKEKALWDYIGDSELRSIVFNLPLTYPPKPINGIMVSSFLTPDTDLSYTYPKEIKNEIEFITGGGYIIDVENFRTNDKEKLLSEIYEMTRQRFKIIKNFIKNKEWDLFIAVEMGIDRIHHGFWSFCFEDSKLYEENNEFKTAIIDYYKFIDKEISEIIKLFDEDTELMIVSDHGAKTLKGTFFINDWLIKNGYLKLKKECKTKSNLNPNNIDWSNTSAWGSGGYYGKIYFNIKDREPNGNISENEVEVLKKKIADDLSSLINDGILINSEFFDPKTIYDETNGCPPDLILYIGNLDWRVSGSVGGESLFMTEKTAIDNANHDINGIYIHSENPKSALDFNEEFHTDTNKIKQFSIFDIVPTVLDKFNIKIPHDLKGKSLISNIDKT